MEGMQRWIGLGVMADSLLNIGRYLAPKLILSAWAVGRRRANPKHHSSPSKFISEANRRITISYFAPGSRLGKGFGCDVRLKH